MPQTTPCLWFDTQGEEAAEFYVSIFPNSRIINIARHGEAGPREPGTVMQVEFELDGQLYRALNGGPQFSFSEAISFEITCADQHEVDHYWDRLSDGGEESQCGWLKDRYGLSWQIIPQALQKLASDPDLNKSQAVIQAMLGMKKIEVSALQAAYDAA